MFEGVKGEGMMGTAATGQDSWRGMMFEEYGKAISAKGGIGLAPVVLDQIIKG